MLVVGGSGSEWNDMHQAAWSLRLAEFAGAIVEHGASWLTIRPYGQLLAAGRQSEAEPRRVIDVRAGCTVIVDAASDGRFRLLRVIEALKATSSLVDEASISAALMDPAPCEPDLTVVVGRSTDLPPSLVWDLAYTELVFIDTTWAALSGDHLRDAITDYASRHRRFGGIE